MNDLLIGLLNVVTNIAYLIAADLTFRRRLYESFGWFVSVVVVSSLHHLCNNLEICFGIDPEIFQRLDHVVAHIAISRAFLIVANYDLMRTSNANSERLHQASIYHTRATPVNYRYVLVKARFADLAAALYTVVVLFASFLAFNTPLEYVFVIGTGVVIVLISYILHWRLKIAGLRKRFYWKAVVGGVLLTLGAGALYLLPDSVNHLLHPAWHLLSAYAAALLIYGTTRHLRVFSMSSLLTREA